VPIEWDLYASSQTFCSESDRLPASNEGLDYIRRQEGQTDQSTHVAYVESFDCCDLCKRLGLSGAQLIEPAMRSDYRLQ
jgi:hypothetical protein